MSAGGRVRRGFVASVKFVGLLVAIPAVFVAVVLVTNGRWSGWPAAASTVVVCGGLWWLFTRHSGRVGRVVLALPVALSLVTAWLCVPAASSQWRTPPPSALAPVQFWDLPTGSRLAFWHLAPPAGVSARSTPVVFVHGGPGGYAGETNRRFLNRLTAVGYDVYVYDQAGAGDSALLREDAYSHARNVADFAAVLERVGTPRSLVVSQSYGAAIVASALAEPGVRDRIEKAVFVEPGAYDASLFDRFSGQELYPGGQPNGGERAAREGRTVLTNPRILLGLVLPPGNEFVSPAEAANAFGAADLRTQMYVSRCAKDYDRVDPSGFPVGINLKANVRIADSQDKTPLKPRLADSRVPIMVMLGECSYIGRPLQTALITDYPVVERVAYARGVGHAIWDGLDDHDDLAVQALREFFEGRAPSLPNYPQKGDVPAFLAQRR